MKRIETAFKKEKYSVIPFSFNAVGHPTLSLQLKNESAIFLLDTGASNNLLDVSFANKLALPLVSTGQKGGGTGGLIHDIYSVGSIDLFYFDLQFSFDQFYAMDFDTIKQALKAKGVQEDFQGILGFDFFKKNSCFIDYANNRIFVKPA